MAVRLWGNFEIKGAKPAWMDERVFFLGWEGLDDEWMLVEDEETTRSERENATQTQGSK